MNTGFNGAVKRQDHLKETVDTASVVVIKSAKANNYKTKPSIEDIIVDYIVDHTYMKNENKTKDRPFEFGTVRFEQSLLGFLTITVPESKAARKIVDDLRKGEHADKFTCEILSETELKASLAEHYKNRLQLKEMAND